MKDFNNNKTYICSRFGKPEKVFGERVDRGLQSRFLEQKKFTCVINFIDLMFKNWFRLELWAGVLWF